ncbi:MAG: Fic family protein [Bacteroidia bacterium]|nr:Fic family protein [Bacteroidia bacterium]
MKPAITALLQRIADLQAQIQAHEPWDAAARRKIERKLRLDWNYHSQSIEGGTLSARETRTIMLGSVDIQGKPLKDVLEMQRHDEVIQEIMRLGRGEKRLSESRIKALHAAIIYEEPASENRALLGQWKTSANEIINYQGEKFLFVLPDEVPGAIHDLLNRTNANWDKLEAGKGDAQHAALMAFDFHLDFLSIHPFYDGNGRTARILLNLILIAFGYPPLIVKTSDKDHYNRLLAEIQGYGASRDLYYEFMAGLLLRAQELVLSALRGGDIEEEEDLMKEIALFKKQQAAKARALRPVAYDAQAVVQALDRLLLPFFEALRQRTQILDDLFSGREDYIRTYGGDKPFAYRLAPEQHFPADAAAWRDRGLPDLPQAPKRLEYLLSWQSYLYDLKNPFSISCEIQARFESYVLYLYVTINGRGGPLTDIAYAELPQFIWDQDAQVSEILQALFDDLKAKIRHD